MSFFVASLYFNSAATKLETYYPDIDCEIIYKDLDKKMITTMAGQEYYSTQISKHNSHLHKAPIVGILPCFCKDMKKSIHDLENTKFKFFNYILNEESDMTICKNYVRIIDYGFEMKMLTSKSIVITNVIIRLLIIKIMDMIGSHTETELIKHTTVSVFACTFINTGVLLMLN